MICSSGHKICQRNLCCVKYVYTVVQANRTPALILEVVIFNDSTTHVSICEGLTRVITSSLICCRRRWRVPREAPKAASPFKSQCKHVRFAWAYEEAQAQLSQQTHCYKWMYRESTLFQQLLCTVIDLLSQFVTQKNLKTCICVSANQENIP